MKVEALDQSTFCIIFQCGVHQWHHNVYVKIRFGKDKIVMKCHSMIVSVCIRVPLYFVGKLYATR